MTTNFDSIARDMEVNSGSENDFYKFPVGKTKLRILTDFVQTHSLYRGKWPNSKYVKMLPHYEKPKADEVVKSSAWAWADIGKEGLKIVQFPYALIKALQDMKNDPEWAFDEFPMPYDITIGNTGEGGARYSLIGSPKPQKVAPDVLAALAEKKPIQDIVNAILEKQGGKKAEPVKAMGGPAFSGKDYPENTEGDQIPFD